MKTKEELKQYFENGDIPKQEEFWEWQDSYWHKDENLPQANVEGLEDILKSKLTKPKLRTGFYILGYNDDIFFPKLNLQSYYLPVWNGSNFTSSNIYYNAEKVGLGTNMPTETLQVEGNIKTKGMIISNLQQITSSPDTKYVVVKPDGTLGWNVQPNNDGANIPLRGTEPNKPITGDLILDNSHGDRMIRSNSYGSYISFLEDGVVEINHRQEEGANVRISGIDINGTYSGGSGMTGYFYYGNVYEDNSFIQKKYADKQHSYTTKELKTGGLWINNKPIYKKTLFFDQIPQNGEIWIDKIMEDMEMIVSHQMFTEWYALDAAFAGNQWKSSAFITLQKDLIKFELANAPDNDYSAIDSFTLTLEYTKKGDQPVQ